MESKFVYAKNLFIHIHFQLFFQIEKKKKRWAKYMNLYQKFILCWRFQLWVYIKLIFVVLIYTCQFIYTRTNTYIFNDLFNFHSLFFFPTPWIVWFNSLQVVLFYISREDIIRECKDSHKPVNVIQGNFYWIFSYLWYYIQIV